MKQPKNLIQRKLIRLILTISTFSLLFAFLVMFSFEIISFRRSAEGQLEILGRMLAQNSTAAIAFNDAGDARQVLSSVEAEKNIQVAVLFNSKNEYFVSNGNSKISNPEKILLPPDGLTKRSNYYELVVPVEQNEKRLGTLYLRRDTRDLNRKVTLYATLMLAVLAVSVLLTYLLSRRFAKSISDPIGALAKTAELVSAEQDYSIRAQLPGPGEIKTLTVAFNDMLSRIESQNHEIQKHAQDLELKVNERTLEIQRQKDFAETVINSSLVLIAVLDKNMCFVGFNKRCEMEFGIEREKILGKRFDEAMPAAIGSPSYNSIVRALQGETVHYESYKSPITGEYYESFGIPLVDENNHVYAALLTAHNITANVIANEKIVISNNELRKKNSELEQFAYVASHDLQEPLRKIQMFSERARHAEGSNEDSAKYLEKIQASANRMSRLIRDVLTYSKLTKLEESFSLVDLNQILDAVKSDFELLIMERGVTIESNSLPSVTGHPLQIHQLFANLIINSIKFCDKPPEIRITSVRAENDELLRLGMNPVEAYYKIVFADNGIGFDPIFKDKIFTIFQRLNVGQKYEGTGIGLALCKKIVENHRGHIEVDSVVDVGTQFSILLPANIH